MPCQASCAVAVLAALYACAPRVTFYTARAGACPKRPQGCSFELISKRPARDYATIGVFDLEALSARKLPNDEASFRATIADAVCRAGGDAVVPGINGDGRYVLATVVKWVDAGTQGPVCPKPSGDAGKSDVRPADKAGATDTADAGGSPEASDVSRPAPSLTLVGLASHAGASW